MGTTQQEQAEAMKRYIREVFIPSYTENFNKDLTANDIKFYGKIHFDRNSTRSNENNSNQEVNNIHCHIIVSRKDQSNKKKLSPVTNHRDTKKGVIRGGFDRTNLFQHVEKGFDNLFQYNGPLTESFEYYNTMRNGSVIEQIKMEERMNEFNNSLQYNDMSSVSQSSSQSMSQLASESASQLAIQKKQEEGKRKSRGLRR